MKMIKESLEEIADLLVIESIDCMLKHYDKYGTWVVYDIVGDLNLDTRGIKNARRSKDDLHRSFSVMVDSKELYDMAAKL